MIIEGLLTTLDLEGRANVAPMGPVANRDLSSFVLRPFRGSTTFDNLLATRRAVFHITDDACLIARAAINQLGALPRLDRVPQWDGVFLPDACRWYALEIESIDQRDPRAEMHCRVVQHRWQRDFVGFHRARHALIEAAILATRVGLIPAADIRLQLKQLRPLVEKTGDAPELETWTLLERWINERLDDAAQPSTRNCRS